MSWNIDNKARKDLIVPCPLHHDEGFKFKRMALCCNRLISRASLMSLSFFYRSPLAVWLVPNAFFLISKVGFDCFVPSFFQGQKSVMLVMLCALSKVRLLVLIWIRKVSLYSQLSFHTFCIMSLSGVKVHKSHNCVPIARTMWSTLKAFLDSCSLWTIDGPVYDRKKPDLHSYHAKILPGVFSLKYFFF